MDLDYFLDVVINTLVKFVFRSVSFYNFSVLPSLRRIHFICWLIYEKLQMGHLIIFIGFHGIGNILLIEIHRFVFNLTSHVHCSLILILRK